MSRPVHFEINSCDAKATVAFFEDVFGWRISKYQDEDYWLADTGEDAWPGIDGAILPSPDDKPRTVNTIEVDDIDATLERLEAAGGEIRVGKRALPGVGWVAYCVEPGGTMFGLHEADQSAGMEDLAGS